MAEVQTFQPRHPAPLVGGVADPQGAVINNDAQYRRYRSAVTTARPDRGSPTVSVRSIFYEVGRRYGRPGDSLGPHAMQAMRIDASVDINPAEAANFEGVARRYSNFSPQWEKMDLAAIAERLAKGVAAASVHGHNNVGTGNLRAGQPVRVVALGTLDSPQTASSSSVFIPRTVDTVGNDHVFAVLVAAANGEGASVTTDVVRLDANTNQPIVPAVQGAAFATACVEALRVVGANMEMSGAGDIFAYAVTRGIHSVVSVVSHTDEGGHMRSILRADAFRVPYGGINQALRQYPALPALANDAQSATSGWVDTVALKTAAVVAHCDPLVPGDGGLYPTVFTSSQGAVLPPGTVDADPSVADGRSIGRQLASDLGRFAPLFMRGLTALFGLRSSSGVAEGHFCTVAARRLNPPADDAVDRHLRYKTVAPYFWIEPTSLIPRDFLGSPAEANDYAAKVTAGHVWSQPCFERYRTLDPSSNAVHAAVSFKMRTARTSGLVASLASAPAPLAEIRLFQFDDSSVVLPGDQGPTPGTVAAKHAAADPVSSYLWVRGQSCIPAPAEFINTNSYYGAKIRYAYFDNDFDARITELPSDSEMSGGEIEWRVTLPTGLATGPSNYGDRHARRARTRAAIGLAQALARSRAFGTAASPSMEISSVPPSFDDPPIRQAYRNEDNAVYEGPTGTTHHAGLGAADDQARTARGGAVNPVVHQQPLRGAPYPRGGGPGGVGGAPPPPPGPQNPAPPGAGGPPAPPPVDQIPVLPVAPADESAAGAQPAPQV
nr:MAG: coat protein [Koper totivirus 3]